MYVGNSKGTICSWYGQNYSIVQKSGIKVHLSMINKCQPQSKQTLVLGAQLQTWFALKNRISHPSIYLKIPFTKMMADICMRNFCHGPPAQMPPIAGPPAQMPPIAGPPLTAYSHSTPCKGLWMAWLSVSMGVVISVNGCGYQCQWVWLSVSKSVLISVNRCGVKSVSINVESIDAKLVHIA